MKNLYFPLFLLISFLGFGQCPTTDITLSSQADVDEFTTNYPSCTDLDFNLIISGNDITDLTPLSGITSLVGLNISNTNLTTLSGLDNLSESTAQAFFTISNNSQLIDISALSNLNTFFALDTFQISNNPLLSSLEGLEGVIELLDFFIFNNSSLENLNGLTALNNVSVLVLRDNINLSNLNGLTNINTIESLLIENNPALNNIDSLNDLETVDFFDIGIINNANLLNCGIESFCEAISNQDVQFSISGNGVGCEDYDTVFEQCTGCFIGQLSLNSQAEVDAFGIQYPNCDTIYGTLFISGDDIVNLTPLQNLTLVEFGNQIIITENDILTNLDGLGNIVDCGQLKINNNPSLTDISGIGNIASVFNFEIIGNASLQNIQNLELLSTGNLEIRNNDALTTLNGLSNLTMINGPLKIDSNNSLIDLSGLENLMGVSNLNIEENATLQNIDAISNIQGSLNTLIIALNPSLINVDGLSGIHNVGFTLWIKNNLLLENLNGLSNMTNGNANTTNLSLEVEFNDTLSDISGLTYLNPNSIANFRLTYNQQLTECSIVSVCSILENQSTNASIGFNGNNCNTNVEVLNNCDASLNSISGAVSYDFNNDDCDLNDYATNNFIVRTTNVFGQTIATTTDDSGNYELRVPEGQVVVEINDTSIPNNFVSSPIQELITFQNTGNSEILDFCITSSGTFNDVNITMIPIGDARPGFESEYVLVYENLGTTISSGTVSLTFDSSRQLYTNASIIPNVVNTNTIEWNYNNLLPFSSEEIVIVFTNETPPINNSDDILSFLSAIVTTSTDNNPEDNTYSLDQIMINSFDPNDKQVSQGSEIFENEVDNNLDYLIRFQNTGTADAINVNITDELSSFLDWNTLRMVSSSHDYNLQVINGNKITFVFDNINLPPQITDEQGSNGYIAFKIKPVSSLQVGDVIENRAKIYFDFNAPIITNTVQTEYVDVLSVEQYFNTNDVILHPNPVENILEFKSDKTVNTLEIYNLLGQSVINTFPNEPIGELDLSSLSSGMYIIKVGVNNTYKSYRVIKE